MSAPKGNRFWEVRTSHGRKLVFESADQLWDAAVKYFEWVEANPLWENKVAQFQGDVIEMPVAVMRAMTLDGLHLSIGMTDQTWINYRSREGFLEVTALVDKVIRDQKFTGAAAGLLNANIIARDLGLKDSTETVLTGHLTDLTEDQLNRKLEQLRNEQKSQDSRD